MTPRELAALCDIAKQAGREILDVYAGGFASRPKDDGSPVTEADLRADRAIRAGLEAAFPGVCLVSEESAPDVARAPERFFLVDPLDGTREFIARNGEFTVNIALVDARRPVAGVVLAPALGAMYWGAAGAGAWREAGGATRAIRTASPAPGAALRVLGSRSHREGATGAWLQRLPQPWQLEAVGSSLKFCRIAEGGADVYPRMGPTSQWDTAAGHAVLAAAGGEVFEAPGRPLSYGAHRPLINPSFVAVGDPAWGFPPLA